MSRDPVTPLGTSSRGEGWHLAGPPGRALALPGAAVGLTCVGVGVTAVAAGEPLPAAVMLVVGTAFGLLPWRRHRRPVPPHDYEGRLGAGLALPFRPVSWRTIVAISLLALLCLGGALTAVLGLTDVARPDTAGAVVAAVLLGGFGLVMAIGAYGGARSRLARDRCILLTPDGIVLSAERTPVRMPWHAVVRLRPHWTLPPRSGFLPRTNPVRNWLTFEVHDELVDGRTRMSAFVGTDEPTVDVDSLAVDPHLALAVIRFYLENPEERGDLRSVAALDRAAAIARDGRDGVPSDG